MTIELGIVIGRFQPVHNGHIRDVIAPACNGSHYVLFLLGSANRSTNINNPFSVEQREAMIRAACNDVNIDNDVHLRFEGISDYSYSDEKWLQQVQSKVNNAVSAIKYIHKDDDINITLYGSEKDSSSYYLQLFPAWDLRLGYSKYIELFSGTEVRERLYTNGNWEELVPKGVANYIHVHYKNSDQETAMLAEHGFINKYKSQFRKPDYIDQALDEVDSYDSDEFVVRDVLHSINDRNYYEPYFITVDSVVLFRGQVLLIKRGHHPGKGLWALPGGFLDHKESLLDSAIREVREETGFRLKPEWAVAQDVFDNPNRSLRGRTVTHGFLFKVPMDVPDGTFDHVINAQFVHAADDAAHAQWVPLADALENEQFTHNMFEDHSDILFELVGRA